MIDALVAGYRRKVALNRAEIETLPNLLLLREATSLIHRIRRLAQGISSEDEVVNRARDMLDFADWLDRHGDEMVRRLE